MSAPLADATEIARRLQGPALDDLVALGVDFLLSRRVADLVEPEWVAEQVVVALEAATSSPQAESRIRARIHKLRELVPQGQLADRLPPDVAAPLHDVLGRPYLPDRLLVGRLLDHEAFEQLVRDVLVGALIDFSRRIRASVPVVTGPASKPLDRLKALGRGVRNVGEGVLGGLQEGVLGGLSQEIEARAERRIREFVEDALQAVIGQVADHLCEDRHAVRYGAMRAHLLDVLLTTDNSVLVGEFYKLHPEDLVQTATAVARALARRDGFKDEVTAAVRMALEAAGDRTLEDILRESGLDETSEDGAARAVATWKAELRTQLARRGREFVATPEFHGWLEALLA